MAKMNVKILTLGILIQFGMMKEFKCDLELDTGFLAKNGKLKIIIVVNR